MIHNTVTEVFNSNIYAYYLSINRNTLVLILRKQCTYCIIVSTLQFSCINVIVDDFDRFDLFFCFAKS